MSNSNVFQDQHHIEQIRKRMWCDREFGQATVMIGTGFSRNAEKISMNTSAFPLWNDLKIKMIDSLSAGESVGESALMLASQYEAMFGRQALDTFLLQSIPDNDYIPGILHRLLLSLPWSDIFTTNYDTLLERTRAFVYERKYDLILTASDIPGRMKPRIIKLHGSFPSQRPFIFTEEDYRTYPVKFAPFVNMVKQSIMENAFCLLGFSGDDPNFLHWTGWVRDTLGESIPPIYLCGLLDLSEPRKKLLENRKIIPIDLSPIFPKTKWPDANIRHFKAMEWFLLNLIYGAPPNTKKWPSKSGSCIFKPSQGLPDIPLGPSALSDPGPIYPDLQGEIEDLNNIQQVWRIKRKEYPGWVVAPKENRENFWMYTENWVDPIFRDIEKLLLPERLYLLYELNWRLETCLVPLFMYQVDIITRIIDSVNPYPHLIKMENVLLSPDLAQSNTLEWNRIGKYWVELNFALAREAREDQDEVRFCHWMEILNKVMGLYSEWQARWYYEQCLFYLSCLDQHKVRENLSQWPIFQDLPFWEVKKASILAELGALKEAESIAENALNNIRSRMRPFCVNFSLLSQEGWTMFLLKAIKDNERGSEKDFVGQYSDRWEKLSNYRCNPWQEVELLELAVNNTLSSDNEELIKKDFDPGRVIKTIRFSSNTNKNFFKAFSFLRIFEEGAIPIRCGSVSMFSEAVIVAAKVVASSVFRWSISSMIRTAKDEKIKDWFSRIRVATMHQDDLNYFHSLFTASLMQSIRTVADNPSQANMFTASFSKNQISLLPELLSRLFFRLSNIKLSEMFQLVVKLYNEPIFYKNYVFHKNIDVMFKRLLDTMSVKEIIGKIPDLLLLPIPNEAGFLVGEIQMWPEPSQYIKWHSRMKLEPSFDRSSWTAPISNLIRIVKDNNPEGRKRAVLRLKMLCEIDALTLDERALFGEALWSKIDNTTGLPSGTDFYDFAFFRLPESSTSNIKESFRKYICSNGFPRIVEHPISPEGKKQKMISYGGNDNRYINDWLISTKTFFYNEDIHISDRLIDWSQEEIIQLFDKAINWWNEEKTEIKNDSLASFSGEVRNRLAYLVPLMNRVILPRIGTAEDAKKIAAENLLVEMEQYGLPVLSTWPAVLFVNLNIKKEIIRKLRVGLNSVIYEEVKDSIWGIRYWLGYAANHKLPEPPKDLFNEIVNRILARRQPGLDAALCCMSAIVEDIPQLFNDYTIINSLCIALEYLISETAITAETNIEKLSKTYTPIKFDERMEYRKLAAILAYSLYKYFKTENDVPETILKWKEICITDILPEVRKTWKE